MSFTDVYPETGQAAAGLDFDVRESGICLHWYHFVRASAHAYTNCISAFVGRFRRLALAIIQGREAMLSRSLRHAAFFSIIILANALVEALRLVLSSLQQSLRHLVLLNDVDMCAPTTQCIAIHSTQQSL